MPEVLSCADVVICRAGAMTVSEVALCGKATIFVPSPNVTNNHQYINAKALYDKNACELLTENELYKLTDTLKDLLEKEEKRDALGLKIKHFAIVDANKRIYREILSIW